MTTMESCSSSSKPGPSVMPSIKHDMLLFLQRCVYLCYGNGKYMFNCTLKCFQSLMEAHRHLQQDQMLQWDAARRLVTHILESTYCILFIPISAISALPRVNVYKTKFIFHPWMEKKHLSGSSEPLVGRNQWKLQWLFDCMLSVWWINATAEHFW